MMATSTTAQDQLPEPIAHLGGMHIRSLGLVDYFWAWQAMRAFTESRTPHVPDELWTLEHHPVFTLGRAGDVQHLVNPGSVPVVHSDRGGQVTYHGPGQIIVYLLVDLQRANLGVRRLVAVMEQAVIDVLQTNGVLAHRRHGAPGVYVDQKKVAALGLRVRKGCSYHGLALNVDMDLQPFSGINPCGYSDLEVTQLRDLGIGLSSVQAGKQLIGALSELLPGEARPTRAPQSVEND